MHFFYFRIIIELLEKIRSHIHILYSVAESITILDNLISLTHITSTKNWVKPKFTKCTAIQNGRHPILDLLTSHAIPNNTVSFKKILKIILFSCIIIIIDFISYFL